MLWSNFAASVFARAGVTSPAMMWWSRNTSRKIAAPKSSGKATLAIQPVPAADQALESQRQLALRGCQNLLRSGLIKAHKTLFG